MAKSDDFFSEFEPHSQHKLLILKSYFEAWGYKLALRAGAGSTLLYVDACAGAGQDDKGNPGSPLIAAKAATVAHANISARRGQPFHIQIIAIEKRRKEFGELREILRPFGEMVQARNGTLEDFIDEVERDFRHVPWLVFIDPFGLDPLRAEVVRRAIAGAQHETFLLFAGQAALRHYGVLDPRTDTQAERRLDRFEAKTGSQIALFEEDNAQIRSERETLAAMAEESRAKRELTAEHARRILDAAYDDGGAWFPVIDGTRRVDRREKFLQLYLERLRLWGAEYRLPIPILSREGTHVYTLVHTTHSAVGHRTMKEAVEYALKKTPLPVWVAERMREQMRTNIDLVAASVRHKFAGQTVRWARDPRDPDAPCVKHYALEQTPMCCGDEGALKTALEKHRLAGRAIIYQFPTPTISANHAAASAATVAGFSIGY